MHNNKIDIAITACVRPEILKTTLESFTANMLHDPKQFRIVMNVDPIGEIGKTWKHMKRIVENMKFGELEINHPNKASYGAAVVWCWSNIKSQYFIHLEDDWKLLQPINLYDVISIMESNTNIAQIRLSKYSNIGARDEHLRVLVPTENRPRLNPSIMNKAFVNNVVRYITPLSNPEKQFNPNFPMLFNICQYWKFYIYYPHHLTGPKTVMDIGRKWMMKHGYRKVLHSRKGIRKNTLSFNTWERHG